MEPINLKELVGANIKELDGKLMFKFLHAADIHLDSPLIGLERYEGAPVERIRGATRTALERLVDLAIDEEVSFVLIAGDLYDGDWKDFNTGLFFTMQMNRLQDAEIKVYIVRGNHDAANRMTLTLRPPKNVHILSTRNPETIINDELGIAIHGQGYATQAVNENIARNYEDPMSGYFNIGLLHTNVDGRTGHDNYAPCSLQELINKGYDYWALGHIHQHEVLNKDPWVVYPGNLQGRHVRETGAKGCCIVECSNRSIETVELHTLDSVRWVLCTVPIQEAKTPVDAINTALQQIEHELKSITTELLAVRIILHGESEAHSDFLNDPEKWRYEFRNQILLLGEAVWLESVRFNSTVPPDLNALSEREDALGDLMGLIQDIQLKPELMEEFQKGILEPLHEKLPRDIGSLDYDLDILKPTYIKERLNDVKQFLHRRIVREGEFV